MVSKLKLKEFLGEEVISAIYDENDESEKTLTDFKEKIMDMYHKFNPNDNLIYMGNDVVDIKNQKVGNAYYYKNAEEFFNNLMSEKPKHVEVKVDYQAGQEPTDNYLEIIIDDKTLFLVVYPAGIVKGKKYMYILIPGPTTIKKINFIFEKSTSKYFMHFNDSGFSTLTFNHPMTIAEITNELERYYNRTYGTNSPFLIQGNINLNDKSLYIEVNNYINDILKVNHGEIKNEEV